MKHYVAINYRFDDTGFAFCEEKGIIRTGAAIKCEECGSFLTDLEWLPPLEVNLSKGKVGDVIFGTIKHFIVSEKFMNLYAENRFKGILSFESVTLYQKGAKLSAAYYYPKIVLSDVHVDIKKSGIVFDGVKECSTCQKAGRIIKKMKGLYLIDESQIKDDIFCTKLLPGDVVFSEQFKNAASGLSNLSFIEAQEYVPSWII